MNVGTVGNDGDFDAVDAIGRQNFGDRARHGDDNGGTPIFPTGADVRAQVKIDSPRPDERNAAGDRG